MKELCVVTKNSPAQRRVHAGAHKANPHNFIRLTQRLLLFALVIGGTGHWKLQGQTTNAPWSDVNLPAEQRAQRLLEAMTLNDKVALVHGSQGTYVGNTTPIPRLGIPVMHLQDGPGGIGGSAAGVTAFPAPIALAATWDLDLARRYGVCVGEEARGKGIHALLGPMMNMSRVRQAGRNFEGFGEDPELASSLAAAVVNGLQSQGVSATAKHFVGNEQETQRQQESSEIDERTLHEVYLAPFRAAVRAGAGSVMAAYNRVNGIYSAESPLLYYVLKKEWGFDGLVMSDWMANYSTAGAAQHGLDLEMPGESQFGAKLRTAIQNGTVPGIRLDEMTLRILTVMFRLGLFEGPATGSLGAVVTTPQHAAFAREEAAASMVLLRNADAVLPLQASAINSIAIIGSLASSPIAVGSGSAAVKTPYVVSPLKAITNRLGTNTLVRYNLGSRSQFAQAAELARQSDLALVFVGESSGEFNDRTGVSLSADLNDLVATIASANPRTVVVLSTSSAVLLPWADQVQGILQTWFGGQEVGNALADVLFGDVNPSGRLPITFSRSATEFPIQTTAQFPGSSTVSYSEGLQIGYRWFDATGHEPLYTFGHGLSYTSFDYGRLSVSAVSTAGEVTVSCSVTNVGSRAGAEVVQLYLGMPASAGEPPKLLRGFHKLPLQPGESAPVEFVLKWEDLAVWSSSLHAWEVPLGAYTVSVGASSRDIRLSGGFDVAAPVLACGEANFALHRAMSTHATNYPPAAAVVDGNPSTVADFPTGSGEMVTLDLGVVRDLARMRLQWVSAPVTASILGSRDGTVWETLAAWNAGVPGSTDLIVQGRSRYLRLADVAGAQPGGNVSLAEWGVFPPQQRPFGMALPSLGRIEAENYDTGGEGVAFHLRHRDPEWTAYRPDGASLSAIRDNRGWFVSGLTNGEWLSYTVDVSPTNPPASLKLWGNGKGGPARLQVRLDGRVVGTAALPPGNELEFATTVVALTLNSGDFGRRVLSLEIIDGLVDLDALELGGPVLALALSNRDLTLKWTTAATNLVLEFCENLASSSWQPVTNRVSRSQNVNYQVTETMFSGSRFYRLRRTE